MDFNHVVKTTIYLSDMELFGEVNIIYGKYFDGDFPARETVAVKGLPKNANVEISMTVPRAASKLRAQRTHERTRQNRPGVFRL